MLMQVGHTSMVLKMSCLNVLSWMLLLFNVDAFKLLPAKPRDILFF